MFWLSYPNGPTYDPAAVFGSVPAGTDYHFYGYESESVGYSPSVTITLPDNKITAGANGTYGRLHSREYWYGAYYMPMIRGYNDAWDEDDYRILASAYVQDEISLLGDRLHLTPGVKYIYARTRDHDDIGFYYPIAGAVSDTEHFVSPTIGASLELLPGFAVYGAFGRNFKLPDISAYYGAFQSPNVGAPVILPVNVKPEYVNDCELGLRLRAAGFAGSVNVYRENFTNTFITLTDPNGLTSTLNGGTSRYQGVEVQLAQELADVGTGHLSAYVNYSLNEAVFLSEFNSEYSGHVLAGQSLAGVPRDLVQGGLSWTLAGVRASVDGRYIGKQFIDQAYVGTPTASTIPAHLVLDMHLSDAVSLGGAAGLKSLKLSLSLTNLLDRRYFNEAFTDSDINSNQFVRAVVAAPRSVFGEVSVDF